MPCNVTKPQLPPETWIEIIHYLSSSRQIPLLHVSRLFHDITIRCLFSTIKIYIIGEEAEDMFETTGEPLRDTTERLMHRSWEILHYITEQPDFASAIKTLTVVAAADSRSIFEQLSLAQALRAIPNLRHFYWFGVCPKFSQVVAESLPPCLQSLHLQSTPNMAVLHHLNAIDHLQLSTPFYYPGGTHFDSLYEFYEDNMDSEDAIAIVETMSRTLKRLVTTWHMGTSPIRAYSSLTELEICVPLDSNTVGMDLVFRHIPHLESLSLVGNLTSEIFFALPNDPAALPNLTAFRLSSEATWLPHIRAEEVDLLSDFITKRVTLRRLYLRLAGCLWDVISTILPVISNLKRLDVLGLHAGRGRLKHEDIKQLLSVLSPNLRALHFAIHWNYPDHEDININLLSPFLCRLAKLPHLAFLHLYGIDAYLPLLPEELAAEMGHLHTVGLNRALWDVDRDGEEAVLAAWSSWRVKFAIEDDFHCQDDAWLFRYH